MPICRICAVSLSGRRLGVAEMWQRTGEVFPYQICDSCGSLQLLEIPADLTPYYGRFYFSAYAASHNWRAAAAVLRTWLLLRAPAPLYSTLTRLSYRNRVHPLRALRRLQLGKDARIADVGSGTGLIALALHRVGFHKITCVEPYGGPTGLPPTITVRRGHLAHVADAFDVIMYHHVLEHIEDWDAEFNAVRSHLAPGGTLLLRLPVIPNAAFEQFDTSWVQIDPPRHINVPSRRGLALALARAGMEVVATGNDSRGFSFWGSRLAQQGIPHGGAGPGARYFSARELSRFDAMADEANRRNMGDQAWFLVRRSTEPPVT